MNPDWADKAARRVAAGEHLEEAIAAELRHEREGWRRRAYSVRLGLAQALQVDGPRPSRAQLEAIIRRAHTELKDISAPAVVAQLENILEHGAHAWHALEVAGVVSEGEVWPPDVRPSDPLPAQHLAATLSRVKALYDTLASESDPG